jgi:L-asparagine transporter-like permease
MKELKKLIDVKSIVTLVLIFSLVYVVVTNKQIDEKVFLLFSNVVTMIVTYFFTKKKTNDEGNEQQ